MVCITASGNDSWCGIASRYGVSLTDLLGVNGLDLSSDPTQPVNSGTAVILPDGAGAICVAPWHDHTVDLGVDESEPFDLPNQKATLLPQPPMDWGGGDNSGFEPFLVAANDDSVVASLIEQARQNNEKRGVDKTVTEPGGFFIPVGKVPTLMRPDIRHDHGFLDDGHGNIDNSKRRDPAMSDMLEKLKWETKLEGAELLRPDLHNATDMYRHFLEATGTEVDFDYNDYVSNDRAGATTLSSALDDIRSGVIEIHEKMGMPDGPFAAQTGPIGVGGDNPRYPYPGTENWQKAIGAHQIWLSASVTVDIHTNPGTRLFAIDFTLHAEDRYNFNPGNQDIATGTPDEENGRFELTGLGKEFDVRATLTRQIYFSLPMAHVADPRGAPSDTKVESARALKSPSDVVGHPTDAGAAPPGGT
jgi:hypothetical protein